MLEQQLDAVRAVKSISVPLLITAMGAHYFVRDNEIHYEVAASRDKDFVVIEGATHGIRAVHRVRDDAGPVLQQRQELLRLRGGVDSRRDSESVGIGCSRFAITD